MKPFLSDFAMHSSGPMVDWNIKYALTVKKKKNMAYSSHFEAPVTFDSHFCVTHLHVK